MLEQPISVIYRDIARLPVTIHVDDALCEGHKIPVAAAALQGTATVIPAFIHTSGNKAPHLIVHGDVWEFAGIPSKEAKSKFPILVRIWNYIVNFVSVTAQVEHSRDTIKIYSEGVKGSDDRQIIYLVMSNQTKDAEQVWVTGTAVDATATPFVIFRILPWLRNNVLVRFAPKRIVQKIAGIIRPSGKLSLSKIAHLRASTVKGALLDRGVRFKVRTQSLVAKIGLRAAVTAKLKTTFKMVTRLRQKSMRITFTRIKLQQERLKAFGSFWVSTVKPQLLAKPLMKIAAVPVNLRKFLSHTQVSVGNPEHKNTTFLRVAAQKVEQAWKSNLQARVRRVGIDKVLATLTSDVTWWAVAKKPTKIILDAPRKAVKSIRTFFTGGGKTQVVRVRGTIQQAVKKTKLALNLNTPVIIKWLRIPVLSQVKKVTRVFVPLRPLLRRKSKILILTNKAVIHTLMEWGVLASLEKASLQFVVRPYSSLYKLRIAASLNQTYVKSFMSVQLSRVSSEIRTTFNTCSYIRKGLIQWYLHRNLVSNEGYSNEILFDLTMLTPVGPIPPAPVEQWKGGYVDYPFKGAGQENIEEATGYLSPEGEEWVKNVKMLWSAPTSIFGAELPIEEEPEEDDG